MKKQQDIQLAIFYKIVLAVLIVVGIGFIAYEFEETLGSSF
ncbi:hypothetical protein [Abyssalbus ytuae]|nr:hypothetical protein [Abyssalbus ytuae]